MNFENVWDRLSSTFDTHQKEIDSGAADNILIAWPSLLRGVVNTQRVSPRDLLALDYGCGVGGFCDHLSKMGYEVKGFDTSLGMLAIAKEKLKTIRFFNEYSFQDNSFDLVTSVMVFQFIDNENIEGVFKKIVRTLKVGGVLAFAVFNPSFVDRNKGALFHDTNGMELNLIFSEESKVSTFIRDDFFYIELAKKLGLKLTFFDKPPFTKEFIEKYPTNDDVEESEYSIFVFKKN